MSLCGVIHRASPVGQNRQYTVQFCHSSRASIFVRTLREMTRHPIPILSSAGNITTMTLIAVCNCYSSAFLCLADVLAGVGYLTIFLLEVKPKRNKSRETLNPEIFQRELLPKVHFNVLNFAHGVHIGYNLHIVDLKIHCCTWQHVVFGNGCFLCQDAMLGVLAPWVFLEIHVVKWYLDIQCNLSGRCSTIWKLYASILFVIIGFFSLGVAIIF